MQLNYNFGICPSGHSSLQKVSPLYEGEAWIQSLCKVVCFFFSYVLNFHKICIRLKMTLTFLSLWTNSLYDGLPRSQILFM